jgi:hypothetical protein
VVWLVLDMDVGVVGAFESRRAAVKEFASGPVIKRHSYGPGAYEYLTGWPDDSYGFFVEREDAASAGWDWAIEAWKKAGCPMGRVDPA